jgi:hypothetical protein
MKTMIITKKLNCFKKNPIKAIYFLSFIIFLKIIFIKEINIFIKILNLKIKNINFINISNLKYN